MRAAVLLDAYANGRPVICIWSDIRTIYQRRDGSYYWVIDSKRETVTRRADGSFYLRTDTQ